MSLADNFDHKSDAGFVRAYDARAARRQFQVSSTLGRALLTRLAPPIAAGRCSAVMPGSAHIAETLLDIRG